MRNVSLKSHNVWNTCSYPPPHEPKPNLQFLFIYLFSISLWAGGGAFIHEPKKIERKQINAGLLSQTLLGLVGHHLSSVFHNHSLSLEASVGFFLIVPLQAKEFKKKKNITFTELRREELGVNTSSHHPSSLHIPLFIGLADALAWDCFFCSLSVVYSPSLSKVMIQLGFLLELLASKHANPGCRISSWHVAPGAVIRGCAVPGSWCQSRSPILTHSAFEYVL